MASSQSIAERATNSFMRAVSNVHVSLYRLTGGKIGGTMQGAPALLLATHGRRSGKLRVTPVFYLQDDGQYVIVASKGGAPKDPVWWLNLKAKPETSIQVGDKLVRVRARQADAEERARLWPRLVDMYNEYADYQQRTEREIPVVILEPV